MVAAVGVVVVEDVGDASAQYAGMTEASADGDLSVGGRDISVHRLHSADDERSGALARSEDIESSGKCYAN